MNLYQSQNFTSGLLGATIQDANGFRWFGQRPSFTAETLELFPDPPFQGAPLCHSISWNCMQQTILDMVNWCLAHSNSVEALKIGSENLYYFLDAFGVQLDFLVGRSNDNYFNQLEDFKQRLFAYNQITRLTTQDLDEVLTTLFNWPFNLRYPRDERVNWNSSVSNNYDVRAWCYIENDLVTSYNDTESCSIPYKVFDGWPGVDSPKQPAFYLLDLLDGCVLYHLLRCAPQKLIVESRISIITGRAVKSGYNIIASSDNIFKIPVWTEYKKPIYYFYNDEWFFF